MDYRFDGKIKLARSAKSFNRARPERPPSPKVLVICEDEKSGKRYVEDATIHHRIKVAVQIIHCGKTDPRGIVKEAIRKRKTFDKVFCMVDRDTHQNWDEALKLANDADGIEIVASYPCFEYWLILHFQANRKPYSRQGQRSPGECCVDDLKKCDSMENYDKGKDEKIFKSLLDRLDTAKKNSKNALEDAKKTGEMNPSTRLHELIEFFEQLEKDSDK